MGEHVPYIAAERTLKETTVKAVGLGILLSVVLGAANTYLGLRVGLTVSASIPAAVVSMALLRLFRERTILENNAVQTAASAGESLAAGILFTIPALLLLGYWSEVGYWQTTLVALAGGFLGVLFTVPLRRALIVEAQLDFPEGIATSEVLKAGEAGGSGVGSLVVGAALGMGVKFMETGLGMWRATADFAARIGNKGVAAMGLDVSPALLGVGYIIGIRIASLVFAGGVLGWFVAMPLYSVYSSGSILTLADGSLFDYAANPAGTAAGAIWSTRIRYIGAGAMLVGGLWSLVKLRQPLGKAIRQGINAARGPDADAGPVIRTEREIGTRATFLGVLAMVIPVMALYWYATQSLAVAAVLGIIMVVTGFLFSAVAGYMAGLVGSSNNPISGVTILTVLAAAFSLRLMGVDSTLGPAATILVAAVIACAGAIAGDNMQDLKAGYLLGATPKRQQAMQMVGVTAAAFAVAPVLNLLDKAYTIGSAELAAPQAGLMASIADAVFNGGLQTAMFAAGTALAILLIILDEILAAKGSTFRTPVMPVAVGIYLPVGLTSPMFIGGLIAWATGRATATRSISIADKGRRAGLLLASGLIAGEALVGIAIAAVLAANDGANPMAVSDATLTWPGLLIFGYLGVVMWHTVTRVKA